MKSITPHKAANEFKQRIGKCCSYKLSGEGKCYSSEKVCKKSKLFQKNNRLKGLAIAFSMYSCVPMPQVDWEKDSMKYAMCFFPFVGVVIGFVVLAFYSLAKRWGINEGLFSAVAVAIPIVLSGGIHLDGFIDTADALSSNQPRERKLEILKDPHVGAFGVMYCVFYVLLSYGVWQQLYNGGEIVFAVCGYVLSRSLVGFMIATFTCAKNSGLAYTFSDAAAKKAVRSCMLLYVAIVLFFLFFCDFKKGFAVSFVCILSFLGYQKYIDREFGGLTGDLAGCFLQGIELLLLAVAMV